MSVQKNLKVNSLQSLVASNVKRLRLLSGLSQEQLADICGYHRTYIGAVERAERNITLATLNSIAVALKTTPEKLLVNGD